MFKFKIVNGKQIEENPQSLGMNELNFLEEDGAPLGNGETFTLLITDLKEDYVLGRLLFNKREFMYLQEEIRELIPVGAYIWEGSVLSFSENDSGPSYPDHFSTDFFRVLYEGIAAFALENEVGFVLIKLSAETYLPTKEIGFWPYVVEFHPDEFSDNFFYGILPLKGKLYEIYKKNWKERGG